MTKERECELLRWRLQELTDRIFGEAYLARTDLVNPNGISALSVTRALMEECFVDGGWDKRDIETIQECIRFFR